MAWVATKFFLSYVVTVDGVATGCGQGWEALCRDTEICRRRRNIVEGIWDFIILLVYFFPVIFFPSLPWSYLSPS